MMMIVRLFPKTDLNKVWHFVENVIAKETSEDITPLYSAQLEGMMSVGVIFDVKNPDNIAHFLTETLSDFDECHHTRTISLMKPVFFPIPKQKPENIQRYVIRIYTHPKNYKTIYNYLINYKYPFNLAIQEIAKPFFGFVTISIGCWPPLMHKFAPCHFLTF